MTHASVRCASQNHFLLSKMQVPCVVDRGLAGLHGPLSDVGRSRRPPGLTSAYTMMAVDDASAQALASDTAPRLTVGSAGRQPGAIDLLPREPRDVAVVQGQMSSVQ